MAYPNPPAHWRITWSGTLGATTPQEIWSCGLSAAGGSAIVDGQGNFDVWLESVTAALAANAEQMLLSCSSTVVLTRTRIAHIGDDGLTVRGTTGAYRQGDNFSTFTGAQTHPGHGPQVAVAVSTRTAFDGPQGRGRYFLPVPGYATSGNDLRLSEGNRDIIASHQASFLNGVNTTLAAADAGLRLVLASGGSVLKGLAPANRTLTEVGVGRTLDTIRTRRNALAEMNEYVSLA